MTPFAFAKAAFDVALCTNLRDEHLAFWRQSVGLADDHMAKLGGGIHQHRFHCGLGILKVNHARAPLTDAPPAGYRALTIATERTGQPTALIDPDGTPVTLVPRGHDGIDQWALTTEANDLDAFDRFYGNALGFAAAGKHRFRCGESLLIGRPAETPILRRNTWRGRGLRYITVQVLDCDAATAFLVDRGVEIAMAPKTLGGLVRFSFVRDPDGNWIEISERSTLTGKPVPTA